MGAKAFRKVDNKYASFIQFEFSFVLFIALASMMFILGLHYYDLHEIWMTKCLMTSSLESERRLHM